MMSQASLSWQFLQRVPAHAFYQAPTSSHHLLPELLSRALTFIGLTLTICILGSSLQVEASSAEGHVLPGALDTWGLRFSSLAQGDHIGEHDVPCSR